MMKNTTLIFFSILSVLAIFGVLWAISALRQGGNHDDFMIDQDTVRRYNLSDLSLNNQDTVVRIPDNSKTATTSMKLHNGGVYSLHFMEDFSIYELCVSDSPESDDSDITIIRTLSWGEYKTRGDKLLFYDRIAGFKMEASVGPDGRIKFLKDYFPDINKKMWDKPKPKPAGGFSSGFIAEFDNKKAERYRKAYDKKFRDPFEFTPGTYLSVTSLEINENGQWKQIFDGLVFAEGKWHRERNILILNCPKLNCNFYMTIGKNRLGSMLLLMDFWGQYYYSPSEYRKIFLQDIE